MSLAQNLSRQIRISSIQIWPSFSESSKDWNSGSHSITGLSGEIAKFDFFTDGNNGFMADFEILVNGSPVQSNFYCNGCDDYGINQLGLLHVDGDSADEANAANCEGSCSFEKG